MKFGKDEDLAKLEAFEVFVCKRFLPKLCEPLVDVLPLCDLDLLQSAVTGDGVVDDLIHEFGGIALQ